MTICRCEGILYSTCPVPRGVTLQNHPPDKNNPSNPLVKVAALGLDKEYLTVAPISKISVAATLNFKRSNDLRGRAKTNSGNDVTVTFSLALKRASLELAVSFEDGPNDAIDIQRVAHMTALHTRDRITNQITAEKQSKKNLSLDIGIAAGAGLTRVDTSAKASGKAGVGKSNKISHKRKISQALSRSNIAATFAGNIVHWEISPNMLPDQGHGTDGAWLEGELFRAGNGKSIEACSVSWRQDGGRGVPVITASVFITMADLIVGNVKVLTDLGDEISLNSVEQGSVSSFGPLNLFTNASAKERFVRQIIRKHLVAQGMTTEGARVQICKAFT
jgi:hypothetical protein